MFVSFKMSCETFSFLFFDSHQIIKDETSCTLCLDHSPKYCPEPRCKPGFLPSPIHRLSLSDLHKPPLPPPSLPRNPHSVGTLCHPLLARPLTGTSPPLFLLLLLLPPSRCRSIILVGTMCWYCRY